MSLETVSWPATSRCQEQRGRPVSRRARWDLLSSLASNRRSAQAAAAATILCDIVSSLQIASPRWQGCLPETLCGILFTFIISYKWTNMMKVQSAAYLRAISSPWKCQVLLYNWGEWKCTMNTNFLRCFLWSGSKYLTTKTTVRPVHSHAG